MKRLILLALLITSCSTDDVTITKEEYNRLKGIKPPVIRNVTFPKDASASMLDWKIITGSDGHDYLENNGNSGFIMMHYVECKKCESDSLK